MIATSSMEPLTGERSGHTFGGGHTVTRLPLHCT